MRRMSDPDLRDHPDDDLDPDAPAAPLEGLEFVTGDDPVASVIVLHGLGADGTDFLQVAQTLDLGAVGVVRFVLPHAPVRAVTINGGFPMRAWYDILADDLGQRGAREDEDGLRTSQALVQAMIEREVARGVDPRRIVLIGFSQGGAMALLAGLRCPLPLAGLAGLSGYLPLAATTAAERSAANADVPVFLAHGTDDEIVPVARGEASRDALVSLGHDVEWHDYPIPHTVCQEEVEDLNRWLLRVLA
jgi:phospholipase/carboxylesterase